ncbi:unnamed protein product [Phaeothamnion confervicola]
MEAIVARDQAGLWQRRENTVPLTAVQRRIIRKWRYDPDTGRPLESVGAPPQWRKAVGNTNNKWANTALVLAAAREEAERDAAAAVTTAATAFAARGHRNWQQHDVGTSRPASAADKTASTHHRSRVGKSTPGAPRPPAVRE